MHVYFATGVHENTPLRPPLRCLFSKANTGNMENTMVETYVLGKFFRRGTHETQIGFDSITTLLFCLRVEELIEGVSEEGNTGNTEWP